MRAWSFGRLAIGAVTLAACASLDGLSSGTAAGDGGGPSGDGGPGLPDGSTLDGSIEAAGDGSPPGTTATFIVAAGGADAQSDRAEVYVTRVAADGSLGPWMTGPSLVGGRSKAALAVRGSTLYFTGGDNAPAVGITDAVCTSTFGVETLGTWSSSSVMPSVLFRHGSFEFLGDIYLVGGSDPSIRSAVLRSTPASDGTLGPFRTELSLPSQRASAGVVRSGNHVYVVAGELPQSGGGTAPSAAGWLGALGSDGSITAWTDLAALPFTTIQPGIAATASHVYVSGGYASGSFAAVVMAPIAADGSLASWTPTSPLLVGRAGHRMVVVGAHIYAIGGVDGADVPMASVEVADLAANGTVSAFRQTTPLPAARGFMSVAVVER